MRDAAELASLLLAGLLPSLAWLGLVGVAVVALNWSWLEGYLLFSHYGDVSEYYSPGGRRHLAPAGGLLAPLRTAVPSPAPFALLPAVFGAAILLGSIAAYFMVFITQSL